MYECGNLAVHLLSKLLVQNTKHKVVRRCLCAAIFHSKLWETIWLGGYRFYV